MSADVAVFYDIESFRDLIKKCSYDLSQLTPTRKAQPSDSYVLFNLVLTLNHLFDWTINDDSLGEDVRVECIKRFNPYKERRQVKDFPVYEDSRLSRFPPTCPQQWLMRQVANRAKHLKTKVIPKLEKVESAIFWKDQWMDITWFVVDDIEGRSVELVGQCQLLLGMWESFISERLP